MNIALIGATGFVGSAILPELLGRGHRVTALVRDPGKLTAQTGRSVVKADALDATQVAQAVGGHDAVISAYNPGWSEPEIYTLFLRGSQAIVEGVKAAGVKRLLVVGGAGSLLVAPGLQLVDTPEFPAAYKQGARGAESKAESTLDWSSVSPPIGLAPDERTGSYRLGTDQLLPGQGDQPAGISVADLAVAIVDEIEQPRHLRQRFTAASRAVPRGLRLRAARPRRAGRASPVTLGNKTRLAQIQRASEAIENIANRHSVVAGRHGHGHGPRP